MTKILENVLTSPKTAADKTPVGIFGDLKETEQIWEERENKIQVKLSLSA